MAKKIQLTIPKPCHEDWNSMTPVEKGKFCGSCQKQVVDFSVMSDRQVAQFFKKPSTGSVCGRFITDQLDRDIEIPKKRIPWLRYFFTIALPAFFVSIKVSASRTQGKIKVTKASTDTTRKHIYDDVKMMGMVTRPQSIKPFVGDTVIVPVNKPVCDKPNSEALSVNPVKGEIEQIIPKDPNIPGIKTEKYLEGRVGGVSVISGGEKKITGFVVDEQNNPIPFASIETPDKKIFVADEYGFFEIKLKYRAKKLVVTAAGFKMNEYTIGEAVNGKVIISLKSNDVLPEVFIEAGYVKGRIISCHVIYSVNKIMGAVTKGINITETAYEEAQIKNTTDNLKLYPNPVYSGASITIEWEKADEGYYNLQLVNTAGQIMYQKEIWIDGEARILNIGMPLVAAGSYSLILTNKKSGRKFTGRLVVT